MSLKTILLKFLGNTAIDVADDFFEKFLESSYAKKPNTTVALVSSLYITVDTLV